MTETVPASGNFNISRTQCIWDLLLTCRVTLDMLPDLSAPPFPLLQTDTRVAGASEVCMRCCVLSGCHASSKLSTHVRCFPSLGRSIQMATEGLLEEGLELDLKRGEKMTRPENVSI
jgi:hypothetical protein